MNAEAPVPPPLLRPPQLRFAWIAIALAVAGLVVAAVVRRSGGEAGRLPVHGRVGEFSFVDQSGADVRSKNLKGRVWVASFIFTRCAGTCLAITGAFTELDRQLADAPDVRLLSFSMDPAHDTPQILSAYAKKQGVQSARWRFVTGKKEDMFRLTRDDFKLAVQEEGGTPDEPIIHSSRLALVDRLGHIRGYYSGTQAEGVRQLAADARRLSRAWDVFALPALNAALNSVCTVLLLSGYVFMRRKRLEAHRDFMISAGVISALFLTSYLIYHYWAGSVPFQGQGWIRPVYYAILISHVLLAAVIALLVPLTFWRAYREDFERHRKIARITFPIWLYVSVTGVLIYLMLYLMPVAQKL